MASEARPRVPGRAGGRLLPRTQPARRHFAVSEVPVSGETLDKTDDPPRVLLAVYTEVVGAWRSLTEVRFKLLALLPPVTAVALGVVVSPTGPLAGTGRGLRIAAATFGLLVTVGLFLYDRRNDELYDDLISRGRRVEYELGLHTGVFLGRPDARRVHWGGGRTSSLVNHHNALMLIYGTVIASWIVVLLGLVLDVLPTV